MTSSHDPWYGTSGPHDAPIVLVGEAWGVEEANAQRPFVGSSGVELNRILADAGLERDDVFVANVVPERPLGNEMWRFFHPRLTPSGSPLGGLDPKDNVRLGLSTLYSQLAARPRHLVIACGNYALWALSRGVVGTSAIRESNGRRIPLELQPLGPTGITSWRGSMLYVEPPVDGTGVPRVPLLPILHPAAILRDWASRSITVHDLRARVSMALSGDWRHNVDPVFMAPPSFIDCISRLSMWLHLADTKPSIPITLACDIETSRGLITCLGLADSASFAMSIPFIRLEADRSFSSWWTHAEELEIVSLLRRVLTHPAIRIVGQNFIYDTQYIQHFLAVTPRLAFDTMLAQNVLFPGTPKTLDHLSSLYCRYHWYWKDDAKEWSGKGSFDDLLRYNAWDCVRTWEIAAEQDTQFTDERPAPGALSLREQLTLKMSVNDMCLDVMGRGVLVDGRQRASLIVECDRALAALYAELEAIIPQSWVDPDGWRDRELRRLGHGRWRKADEKYVMWYRSETQTKTVLHDILGLPTVLSRKTGNPTSGKEARATLAEKYPVYRGLFSRLGLAESIDNTRGVLASKLDPDGRMRCAFNPGGTETHRLSSSKNVFGRGTNLQNLTTGGRE